MGNDQRMPVSNTPPACPQAGSQQSALHRCAATTYDAGVMKVMNETPPKRSVLLKAFLASFTIYLLPLIGPHALWILGGHLIARLARSGPDRAVAWIAMEWGLALALQFVAGAFWYRFFARPKWWRVLPLALCAPAFFLIFEWAFLIAIPSRFLIEQDTAPESGRWSNVCTIADMSLAPVRSTPDFREAWLTGTGINSFAVLELPGCQTTPVGLPATAPLMTLPFVVPGGRCLFATWDNKAGRNHWWIHAGSTRPLPRPPTDPNRCAPILSADGNWVAWLEYIPGVTVTPLPQRAVIRSVNDDRERFVNLPADRSEFVLLDLNVDTEELTFYEHAYATRQSSLMLLGFDGTRHGQIVVDGVEPQATTFLRVGQGWVAWDAYRENQPYRVAWSLPSGRGTHPVLKGRGITAVAVNPSGTFVAISTTTALNIGHVKDAVYVLRASDGTEVWRRYLPTYARSSVVFLGEKLFAYTDWDGAHAAVHVLQLPE